MCERLGLHKPVVEQCQYNMLFRHTFEKDYRRIFSDYGYGSTIWSPLGGGILSGKYNDGNIPDGSRYSDNGGKNVSWIWARYMTPTTKDKTVEKL